MVVYGPDGRPIPREGEVLARVGAEVQARRGSEAREAEAREQAALAGTREAEAREQGRWPGPRGGGAGAGGGG